jgi:hypothetical protein
MGVPCDCEVLRHPARTHFCNPVSCEHWCAHYPAKCLVLVVCQSFSLMCLCSLIRTYAWHTLVSVGHVRGHLGCCWSSVCHAVKESSAWSSHAEIKSYCILKHLVIFWVGLPCVKWLCGDRTCMWCHILAVLWQLMCAHYIVKSAVRWCHFTWDMLLPCFFETSLYFCILRWWRWWLGQCDV